jgi:hypothetical protein
MVVWQKLQQRPDFLSRMPHFQAIPLAIAHLTHHLIVVVIIIIITLHAQLQLWCCSVSTPDILCPAAQA